jgi:hypothetical protein
MDQRPLGENQLVESRLEVEQLLIDGLSELAEENLWDNI